MTSIDRTPLVAFIGEPNVGKSTLLKRITGLKKIVVANEPHTTRDLNYGEDWWSGYLIRFVDTGGLVPDPEDKIQREVQLKSWSAIAEADLLVWVLSVKRDPDTISQKILHRLWKTGKPFIIAVNKVDDPNFDADLSEYAQFGGVGFVNMSARSGYGLNDLLDTIVEWMEKEGFVRPEGFEEKLPGKEYRRKEAQTVKKDEEGGYYIVRESSTEGPGLFSSVSQREEFQEIENIVLDLGGVVFKPQHHQIFDYLAETQELNVDPEEVWNRTYESFLQTKPKPGFLAKPAFWKVLAVNLGLEEKLATKLKKVFFAGTQANEETQEFLEEQSQANKKLYFLTNAETPEIFESREVHEIMDMFDGGIASHWVGVSKPNPEFYKILIHKYQLDPKKTLFVDDKAENVYTAIKMGMKGLVYNHETTNLSSELERITSTPKPKKEIKNVIFDFYDVVFDNGRAGFYSYLEANGVNLTQKHRAQIDSCLSEVYTEQRNVEEAAEEIVAKIAPGLHVRDVLSNLQHSVQENPEVVEFLQDQKMEGRKIYFLTNASKTSFRNRTSSPVYKLFDGGLASYEISVSKPDLGIYTALIKKYNLDPESTVFIDDKLENIEAARQAGFWGVQYIQDETDLYQAMGRIEHGITSRLPKIPKILLLGKPNVGKSSIFNGLIQKDVQIVTEIPGTTLSVNDYLIEQPDRGKKFILLDSTGIRKSGQRTMGAETFATYKTIEAATEADVLCLVLDGSQPLTHQDQVVAGICKTARKGLVVIANKADLVGEEEQAKFQKDFRYRFQFLKIDKFIWVSAMKPEPGQKQGKFLVGNTSLDQIWTAVDEALENRSKVIERAELRTLFNYLMKQKPPKKLSLKKRPVIYDLVYTKSEPPTFELLVKDPETIHWSYVRFLENLIRKQFNFSATGIVVKLTPVQRKKVLS